ncbi:MAG: hypothetical protein HUK03_09350, partial [Bacteroidaceae bacterium]|nr:hypothetical protein [Bacteroidaceae bacterium]
YFRDYEKLYSRVFPVYDRPKTPGVYEPQMTLRPLRRPRDNHSDKLRLSLFPEGGNLMAGIPCRVAFEATREDGEWVDGVCSVQDSVTSPTLHRGRGTFQFVPEADKEQEVTFRAADGRQVRARLPKPQPSGGALRVESGGKTWRLDVRLTPDVPPQSVGLAVSHEGRPYAFYALRQSEETFEFAPPTLACGVFQATLFDEDGQVLADRLFFHRPEVLSRPNMTVEDVKPQYAPHERIDLTLRRTDAQRGARASVAIRDAGTSIRNHDTGNILTEMLLASEVRGFISDPGYYFEADDEEHRTALDLLLMTQGWHRFNWRDMAVEGAWELTQPVEKQSLLRGQVYPANSADPRLRDVEDEHIAFHQEWTFGSGLSYNDFTALWQKNKEEALSELLRFSQKQKKKEERQDGDTLKNEYYIHNSIKEGNVRYVNAEILTRDGGAFEMTIQPFYGTSLLFLAASSSTKYYPNRSHEWAEMRDMEYLTPTELAISQVTPSELLVLVDNPYPRFVRPYDHYQQTQVLPSVGDTAQWHEPGVTSLRETEVKSSFGGLFRFNDSYPAFVVDHFDGQNEVIDAGLYYTTNTEMKTRLGDMGLEAMPGREEELVDNAIDRSGHCAENALSVVHRLGATRSRRLMEYDMDIPSDSLYGSKYLRSMAPHSSVGDKELRGYLGLGAIDRSFYYTDYSPRLMGDERYAKDFPQVNIVHYNYNGEGQHPVYVDRCIRLQGFAPPAQFYSPDYSRQPLPEVKDYRRTLYWNPDL